jgi:aminoglycoside N3'-acetyltransferase
VVGALRQAVGPDGHVVVPTGTEQNSKTWRAHLACIGGLTPAEVNKYYLNMPAFDMETTPSGMGAI